MPSLHILSPHDKLTVERINLTDEAHLCNPQRLDDPVQATLPIMDVCSDNYAALGEFTTLSELSLSHGWLCEHRQSPTGQPTRPIPDFSQGVLRVVATRLRRVYLSKCGLCERCLEKIHLDLLENVTYLNLVCNRLLEFPLVVTGLKQLRELHVSANVDMCPVQTETILRRLEAEDQLPVMPHLKVFASSFCDLQDYSSLLFKLMPNVNNLQLSHCALSQWPAPVVELMKREQPLILEVQNNYLSRLPAVMAERRPTSQCVVNINDNRLGNKNEPQVTSSVAQCTDQCADLCADLCDEPASVGWPDRHVVPEQETCVSRDGNSNHTPDFAREAECQDASLGAESTQPSPPQQDSNDANENTPVSAEETKPAVKESSSLPMGYSCAETRQAGPPSSLGLTLMTIWHALLIRMRCHAATCEAENCILDSSSSSSRVDEDSDHSQPFDFFSFIGFHGNAGGGDDRGHCTAQYAMRGCTGLLDFLRRAHHEHSRRQQSQHAYNDSADASADHLPGEPSSVNYLPRWTTTPSMFARHLDTGQPAQR